MYEFNHCEYCVTGSLQCRRILAGWVEYFHRMFRPPSWNWKNSGELERGKKKLKVYEAWEGERKLGKGGHSVILAPILPVCSESKMAAKHSKDHQNRLHCRLCDRCHGWPVAALPWLLLAYHCSFANPLVCYVTPTSHQILASLSLYSSFMVFPHLFSVYPW